MLVFCGTRIGGEIERAYRDHVGGHVAHTAGPALGRVIQHVVYPKARVLLGQGVKVLLEKDVLLGDVGKDEVNLGLVAGGAAAYDSTHDLQHGGDASAAGDHAEVADHVGSVYEGALGPAEADGLTDDEGGHVTRDVALRVRLDEEVEVAGLVVARDWGVGTDDLLVRSFGLGKDGTDGDVLADGEAED